MEEIRNYEAREELGLCARMREKIPDMFDGCLDAMSAEAVRAHLSVCYFCAKVAGEMERTIELVESMPIAEPFMDFGPSIMARINALEKEQSPLRKLWGVFKR